LRGHAPQDVHVGSEVPLGMFLPTGILWDLLSIFCFHAALARTPPKIKFLILWNAANVVHRNSLLNFGSYSLRSSDFRVEKQTRRLASRSLL